MHCSALIVNYSSDGLDGLPSVYMQANDRKLPVKDTMMIHEYIHVTVIMLWVCFTCNIFHLISSN